MEKTQIQKYIKEYLKEHLTIRAKSECGDITISLLLDGKVIYSSSTLIHTID